MAITLSPTTEKAVVDAAAALGYATPDELVRVAVAAMVAIPCGPPTDEELDALLDEADRSGGTPLAEVREQLRQQFGLDRL